MSEAMQQTEQGLTVVNMTLAPIAEVRAKLEDRRYLQLIKDVHCPGATDLEFQHCIATAHHLGLDPVARQIFFITAFDSKTRREKWIPIVAVAGLRAIAQRTGEYEGQTRGQWCGPDGDWKAVWLADGPPAAAEIGVWRTGYREPTYGITTYREFCRRTKDGRPMALWATHPSHMLMKCAVAQALRASFPQEMAGDYGIKDVSMPGEPGRFRTRDETPALPEGPPLAEVIEAMRQAQTFAELEKATSQLKDRDMTEPEREAGLDAWNEARERITATVRNVSRETKGNGKKTKANGNAKRSKPKAEAEAEPAADAGPAGDYDFGPPPWDEANPGSTEPDQPDFGFDDQAGEK